MTLTQSQRVIVVDDDVNFLQFVKSLLNQSCELRTASSLDELFLVASPGYAGIILLDRFLGAIDTLEQVGRIRNKFPHAKVIFLTASTDEDAVVTAIKQGAFDYVSKPNLAARLEESISKAQQESMCDFGALPEASPEWAGDQLGISEEFLTLSAKLQGISRTDATVFIQGESGTGKELVARAIHQNGRRAAKPFVAINMAAVPTDLLESTLFGQEKGSFTGADRSRAGCIEEANGGVLLLDEIGDMPLNLQPKILRFLETRSTRRLGGDKDIPIDVQVVSATNQDPLAQVERGQLRLDLFYRLNTVHIILPPLRERTGDIEYLALHFLSEFASKYKRSFQTIAKDTLEKFEHARWSGNIRQLRQVIENACIFNDGSHLTSDMLPDNWDACLGSAFDPEEAAPEFTQAIKYQANETLKSMEEKAVRLALHRESGSVAKAAQSLGISLATMYRKVRQFDIKD